VTASACPFCAGDRPAADHRIADLGATVVYLHDDQFFPGWVVLKLKRHATELFQLDADERARMMDEVARVAAALHALFTPRKVNYECLGNQIAHIHWHVIPRLPEDPAPRDAVWTVSHTPVRLAPAERDDRIAKIRARLVDSCAPRPA
jgi:diadenosine tetraphosphate (Ap4A) HIT family hydrolase